MLVLVALPGLLIEIAQVLAAKLGVLRQIEGAAMGDPLQLLRFFRKREQVFDIGRADRVMGQFILALLAGPELIRVNAELRVPADAHVTPVLVPFHRLVGVTKELDLHLLEFATAKRVVARIDLIAKRLADLGDPKG